MHNSNERSPYQLIKALNQLYILWQKQGVFTLFAVLKATKNRYTVRLGFLMGKPMVSMLLRLVITVVYGYIGLLLAFPLSYFFQDGLYGEMSWWEYVSAGKSSIFIGAQFGSLDVYRYTAIASVIAVIIIGRFAEWAFIRRKKSLNSSKLSSR